MIPNETVEIILDTARIEDVVSDYVSLKRRGANFVACCPFHNEKTPSFYVSPSKGIYKCFGCGESGTAVGFVMKQESCSYPDALRYLARKYHIDIVEEEESSEELARRQHNESLLLVSEFARKFFVDSLAGKEGRSIGYNYFLSRGLEPATIEKYGLGWAPKSKTALTDAALAAGYKSDYLLETGLCASREDGSLSDRFFDRVMFPIHSVSGRVIAFGGRTLRTDKEVAKYVNSKESEIYVKNKSLYGLYFAKNEIARQGCCYLVEGYLDVLSMHQLGITNVVASSGTSLTENQIRLIRKFTENVTIMYDGDSAGKKAALRGIGMVLKEGMNVKVLLLPEDEDPDSFARKHTLEEVRSFIEENSRDFIAFKSDLLLMEAGNDPMKKAALINDIADTIADIPDAVKRSVYVEDCALKFKISSDILFNRINETRRRVKEESSKREGGQDATEPQMVVEAPVVENRTMAPAERDLLYFLLTHGDSILDFESDSPFYAGDEEEKSTVAEFIRGAVEADDSHFSNTQYRKVYEGYFEALDRGLTQEEAVKSLYDSQDRSLAAAAMDLSVEKHLLTIKNFENALTTTSSWLASYVPKAIIYFQERRLQSRIDELKHSLSSLDGEAQLEALKEMMKLQTAQRKVKSQIGREKII